jgi:hypothetical protein
MLTLLVMRYADMHRVHPQMDISHVCSHCGHQVGIYPSGQRAIQQHQPVTIICHRCEPRPERFTLAPGALLEPLQSKRK